MHETSPHLTTIFFPQGYFSHEGYLSGLTLNKNHTSLLPEYQRVLRFYGYDVGLGSGNSFPPTTSTTTTTTTTMSTPNEDVSSMMDTTETMTTMEPKGMVTESNDMTGSSDMTESNDMTGSTAITYTAALSATETVQEPDTTKEQDLIPTTTSPEVGITFTTLNMPHQSTTSPIPSGDDIATAGESTTLLTSDAASGNEQASSLLSAPITIPVSPMDDEGVSTPAEITSTAVPGKVPAESVPTVPQETTEQQTHTAEPTEQTTELTALMEQPTEMVAGTEKTTQIVALTEEITETVTLTEQQTETMSPMGTILQTLQTTETVAQTEQTGTVVPTEQPTGTGTLTEEKTEMQTLTEEPTERMTVLPVTSITDNTIPDNATEHVVSTETDTKESTVPDRDVLIQSTNRISEPKMILTTPLPLAYNLPNPTHEHSTMMSSKRTTRSIEGKEIVFQ